MDKKRLLITGVSGLLGSNLAYYFRDKYEVLGIYNTHPFAPSWCRTQQADLTLPGESSRVVKEFSPDVCIHCAALADIDQCEEQPGLAYKLNVDLPKRVADAVTGHGAIMVHISTDNVFDGKKGNYTEEDPVGPLSYYSETKFQAEKALAGYAACLIVRTSFYGSGGVTKKSLVEWAVTELAAGRGIKGFTDVITSNIYTADCAKLLGAAVLKGMTGLIHLACHDARSKYDLLCDVARRSGFDVARVKPLSVDDFPFKAHRPKNISLNVSKLATTVGAGNVPSSVLSMAHFFRDSEICKDAP
jgi:dTDP-4-dehydrorhamnose reductase